MENGKLTKKVGDIVFFIDNEGNVKGAASMSHQEVHKILVQLNEFETGETENNK